MRIRTVGESRGIIARTTQWYSPLHDTGDVPFVPAQVTVASVAQQVGAQGEQAPHYEQVSNAQWWYDPGSGQDRVPLLANAPLPAYFTDSDPFAWPSTQQTWLGAVVDLTAVRESPGGASAAQIAALQADLSQQQDGPTAQVWFAPEASEDGFYPLVSVPFDPAPLVGATQQQADPTEGLRNDRPWFQTPSDPVDGPLRASRYTAPNGPAVVDAPASYGALAIADGAVSLWRLDEPSNSQAGPLTEGWMTVYDVATVAGQDWRTGQWIGRPVNVKPGLLTGDNDGAAGFDGASYIYVPAAEMFNPSAGDFAVEMRVSTLGSLALMVLAGQGRSAANAGWQLTSISAAGDLAFECRDAASTGSNISTTGTGKAIGDGLPHTVLAGRLGDTGFLYVDGFLVKSGSGFAVSVTSAEPFTIGADSIGVNNFTGTAKDVAVYPRGLGPAEALNHHLAATGHLPVWMPVRMLPDPSESLSNAQTWFAPDLPADTLSPIPTPTTATAAQDAALWQDQSGQQDRGIQPVWGHPNLDLFAQGPTLPPVITVGGTTPPVLIDAETGDIFLSIGGPLIVSATNG